jgi:hypothetical protein
MQTTTDFFYEQGVTGTGDLNKWCANGYAFISPHNKEIFPVDLQRFLPKGIDINSFFIKDGGLYVYVNGNFHYIDESMVTVNIFIFKNVHEHSEVFEVKVNVLDFDWVFNKYPESGFWSYKTPGDPFKEFIVLLKRTGHRKFKKIVEADYNIHVLHITSTYMKALLNKSTLFHNGPLSNAYYYYIDQQFTENEKLKLFNFGKQEKTTLADIKNKFLHVVNKDWLLSLGIIGTNKYELYYNELLAAELDDMYNIKKLWIPSLEQEILDLPKGI